MNLPDFLALLDGVKQTGQNQYIARCPAHDDKKPSLSVSQSENGNILLYCQCGCSTENVIFAMGLNLSDLYSDNGRTLPREPGAAANDTGPKQGTPRAECNQAAPATMQPGEKRSSFLNWYAAKNNLSLEAIYSYCYGSFADGLAKVRFRNADGKKDFRWMMDDPAKKSGFSMNRGNCPHRLYAPGAIESPLFIVEGEKDADNMTSLGYFAISGENGADKSGRNWLDEYTAQLTGIDCIFIIPDNDDIGHPFMQAVAGKLYAAGIRNVHILDLRSAWPDMPEKADISDYLDTFGAERTAATITELCLSAAAWTPSGQDDPGLTTPQASNDEITGDPFLSCFKTLEDFSEEEATWLIPSWIPEGQITLMAADGGVGKTTLWCNLIAAISSGNSCILDPPEYTREPQSVAFLTTEDSVRKKLRKKLRIAGADMNNIITPDFLDDKSGALRNFKFGSPEMGRFVRHFRPALCVFDPVQGFIPPEINMGSRNAMRDCMAPLISLGEECGTTFLVICHTNKRKGAYGRDRIADSADLWDISRSVLMAGYTEDQGIRYLSNEKNNYSELQKTVLFTIDEDGQPHSEGSTYKRDREYMQAVAVNNSAPKRIECAEWIINELVNAGGTIPTKKLESDAKDAGYSYSTIRRAKDELKIANKVKYIQIGYGTEKTWNIKLIGDLAQAPNNVIPF